MTAKDLKNAFLQEAVQGKLVPQIASEGNARDLLNEIRKARHSELVSESKNKPKKEKPLPEITEEDIPFDIPENWCWCRLGELGDFVRGSGIKRDETTNTGLPCVRYGEMYTTYKIKFSKTKSFTSKDVFEKCHKIHTNDILMALTGENKWDIALAATYEGTEELAMGGDLCKFTPINCNSLFLVYLINSPYGIEYKRNTSTGDIIVHTSTTKLGNLLIPLPPLAEQKRIVAAIEKFMPLIEEYGKKETELKALNEQIGTLTKKAILQEAVQGKLVPQIADEGNAKDLLEEIKKEKAKVAGKASSTSFASKTRTKEFPPITDDEIPFDIPENWCWCRLGEIVSILGDGIHGTPNYDISGNYYFVNGNNLNDGKIEIKSDTKKVNQSEYEKYKKELNKNTVFVSINGTLGNVAFYENENIILGKSACYFNLIKNEMKKFIYWLIKTKYFLDYANQEATGTTIKNVSLAAMRNFPLPLPPLAEQKRIVAAIEKMLPLCEKLGE